MTKVKLGVFGAGRGMTMVNEILHDPMAELVAVCDKYKPLLDNCKKVAEAAGFHVFFRSSKPQIFGGFFEYRNSDSISVFVLGCICTQFAFGAKFGRQVLDYTLII